MIAITFALPEESKDFIGELHHHAQTLEGSLPIVLGNINGSEIVVCHTGVGADSARRMIMALFSRHRPRCLISSGFAGALDPHLVCGDLVVGENFSDAGPLQACRSLSGDPCIYGKLTTQPRVAASVGAKAAALARESGAVAVDMETHTIHELCARAGVPMLSLRAISDTAQQALPIPFEVWFDPVAQKPRTLALLRHLATNPDVIGPFARFVRGVVIAREQLTQHLLRLAGAV